MNLTPTRLEYVFEDESGYAFKVVVERTPRGWGAVATLRGYDGLVTPEAALQSLATDVREFLRMLPKEES